MPAPEKYVVIARATAKTHSALAHGNGRSPLSYRLGFYGVVMCNEFPRELLKRVHLQLLEPLLQPFSAD